MGAADDDEGAASGGWLVSYADLMTLLFAAFVVLYALKPEGEDSKIVGVTSSIRESFVKVPESIPVDERKGPIKNGKYAFQHFKGEQTREPIIKQFRQKKMVVQVIDDDIDKLNNIVKELNANKSAQSAEMSSTTKAAELVKTDNEIRLRILSHVLYEPGQVRPRESSMAAIDKLGASLRELSREFVIEGHTDSSIPSGGKTNWDLSIGRASYLAQYFESKVGIPKTKISASGYADTRPIAPNHTAVGRSQNRRVEIKIRYENP